MISPVRVYLLEEKGAGGRAINIKKLSNNTPVPCIYVGEKGRGGAKRERDIVMKLAK